MSLSIPEFSAPGGRGDVAAPGTERPTPRTRRPARRRRNWVRSGNPRPRPPKLGSFGKPGARRTRPRPPRSPCPPPPCRLWVRFARRPSPASTRAGDARSPVALPQPPRAAFGFVSQNGVRASRRPCRAFPRARRPGPKLGSFRNAAPGPRRGRGGPGRDVHEPRARGSVVKYRRAGRGRPGKASGLAPDRGGPESRGTPQRDECSVAQGLLDRSQRTAFRDRQGSGLGALASPRRSWIGSPGRCVGTGCAKVASFGAHRPGDPTVLIRWGILGDGGRCRQRAPSFSETTP